MTGEVPTQGLAVGDRLLDFGPPGLSTALGLSAHALPG
jgi:hypothetical protein